MDALHQAVKDSGGVSVVASKLGISVQRLSNWMARGVPIEHSWALERATDGRIRRADLRPDDAHLIWPDISQAQTPEKTTEAA